MKKSKELIVAIAALFALMLASCEAPKVGLFPDLESGQVGQQISPNLVKLQVGDKLSILVSSKNPELAYLFNKPVVGRYSSATSGRSLSTSTISHYTVDADGSIDFPVLGRLNVVGMTRAEVSDFIKNKLLLSDMIKDPIVTVDFVDMYFSVMGEVRKPGRFIIDHDKTTLLDALSQAGDMTIYGRRDNVLVMRDEGGVQTAYRLDLRNTQALYSSPAFYLQQNDIIYIEPNAKRARESQATGNSFLSPSLWLSIASFTTSLMVLIFR